MVQNSSTLFVEAIVPIAVYSAFAFSRRYLPAKSHPSNCEFSLDDLSTRFATTQWLINTSILFVGVAFAFSMHALLVSLNRYASTSQTPDGLQLWPQPAIWWFFPGFGALTISWELVLLLWSWFGNGREASLYEAWSNRRAGIDCTKVLRGMGLLITLPIGIFTALAIPMHATLGASGIIDCGYGFAGCQKYDYADAKRMTQIDGFRNRDGTLTARAGIVVDFKDGRRWSSAEWGDFSRSVDPHLSEFLKTKTGLSIGHAATTTEIDTGLGQTKGSAKR
jgi:hypothetical protein